jgi:hypothetical protein
MKNPNLNVSKNSRQHNGKAHRVLQWHAALHCKLEFPEKLTLGMQGKPLLLLRLQHSYRCYFWSFMNSMQILKLKRKSIWSGIFSPLYPWDLKPKTKLKDIPVGQCIALDFA